jgi:hypothetical protein
MILLDTNVVSELRRHDRADRNVAAWAVALNPLDLFVSAVTILEIEVGILQRQRRDPRQAAVLRAWLTERVLPQFDGRILPVDSAVARRCAALHVPDPRPHLDAMIAATALVHGLTLATRNTAEFRDMGVALVDPWTSSG